mgnify:CR=1 FL=1
MSYIILTETKETKNPTPDELLTLLEEKISSKWVFLLKIQNEKYFYKFI